MSATTKRYKYFVGTKDIFQQLVELNKIEDNYIIFLEDTHEIYKGTKCYSTYSLRIVNEKPDNPEANILYSVNGVLMTYTGYEWITFSSGSSDGSDGNLKIGESSSAKLAFVSGVLQANVKVSKDTSNVLQIKEDGLSVERDKLGETIVVNGVNVGGITDGMVLDSNITFLDFAKKMLLKAIPATYTAPTIAIANNSGQASGNVEAGTSITVKLRATFTKNDAGDLSSISFLKGSTSVQNGTSSPLIYTGSAFVVGDETVTFKASASYAEGPIKNDNLGNPSPNGHIQAGTINSSSYSITGKRKLFYGTGVGAVPTLNSENIRALSNNKLAPTNGLSFTINVAAGQQYIIFAYESTLRDVSKVKYEETNDSTLAQNFTKTLVNIADARGGSNGLKEYKVYSYGMDAPAPAAMTLTVTI